MISPVLFDTDPSFSCSFFNQTIVYRSFYGAPLTFCYKEKLFVWARVFKSLAWSMFTCVQKKIIFRLCLLHEDGIVEAQEQNNLPFNYDSVS